MLTTENAKERLFCPRCGRDGAYDCSGEGDWVCGDENCAIDKSRPWISPLRERDLQGHELARLRLENEQLRMALQAAIAKAEGK